MIDSAFIKDCKDDLLKKKANLIITLFGESAGSGDAKNTKIQGQSLEIHSSQKRVENST